MNARTWVGLIVGVLVALFLAHALRYEPLQTHMEGARVVTVVWDRWQHQRCMTVYFLGTDSHSDALAPRGSGESVPSELTLHRCY